MDCEVQREERDQSVDQEAMREIPFGIILRLVVSIVVVVVMAVVAELVALMILLTWPDLGDVAAIQGCCSNCKWEKIVAATTSKCGRKKSQTKLKELGRGILQRPNIRMVCAIQRTNIVENEEQWLV